MAAVFWLIGGIALIAAEMLSGDFFLLMVGVGALAGAGSEVLFATRWSAPRCSLSSRSAW